MQCANLATSLENLISLYTNKKGTDQPAHISTHMGQYHLLSVLAARLSPLNIDHSGNLPVEVCGINYTEKYTNL